ncbi:MAG: 50S ribosomal protein L24 [Candidatus Pacebacteria bacterium]|nr:50S ribosomal protein L24 [Candidatus Paceibacterota bacterium]
MKIKKSDIVQIICGKDKGKSGKVLRVFPKLEQALVEGMNIKKKNRKATKSGQKGQIIEKAYPVHISNLMLLDPKTKQPTRVGKKLVKGKFVRISKKSGTIL